MIAAVAAALSAGCFLLAIHPFVIYPWSLRFMRRRAVPVSVAAAARPSLAICTSAYNEERVIRDKAESLLAMAREYGPAEIYIYVDGQKDNTLAILEEYRGRIHVVSSPERRGKTAGLKTVVAMSDAELLAFTDANVLSAPDSLVRLQAALHDPTVGCAGAQLVYTNPDETATARTGAVYWSAEERMKALESATVGVIGVDGALFMIRRAVYEAPPDDIIDDLYVSLATLLRGSHVVSVPGVVVNERNATVAQEEFQRKARISCQAINVHRLLWPRLRKLPGPVLYAYVSHRLLKWLVPYSLLGAAAFGAVALFAIVGPLWAVVLMALGAAAFAGAVAAKVRPVVRAGVYAYMLAGVGKGVYESVVLRKRYVTWKPAMSVRA